MDWFLKNHVCELQFAENNLIQALLSHFNLFRDESGVQIEICLDRRTPTIRRREAKKELKSKMQHFKDKANDYQKTLDSVLIDNTCDKFPFNDSEFVFRYASGGTLPIIVKGTKEYYTLFYRDVHPIGWNIANGGCDSFEELLNPISAIIRELQEELILIDPKKNAWFLFITDDKNSLFLPEFEMARKLWQAYFPANNLRNFNNVAASIEWEYGPDTLKIKYEKEKPKTIHECFININALDFGIEIDRIAKIEITNETVPLDGEILDGKLLDRPIGLFEVNAFNEKIKKNETEFIPDIIFHSGSKEPQNKIDNIVKDEFIPRLLADQIRTKDECKEWEENKQKYNLCPATKAIINRFIRIDKKKTPYQKFDVFISHSSLDKIIVEKIIEDFKKESITYWVDHEQITLGDRITEKIENGLKKSKYVLVCISHNLGHSNWCRAEYGPILNMQYNEISGKKAIPLKLNEVDDQDIPVLLYDVKKADYQNYDEYQELLNYLKS